MKKEYIPKSLDDAIYQSLIETPEKWSVKSRKVFRRCRVFYWICRYDDDGVFICKILDTGSYFKTDNLVPSGCVSDKTLRLVQNIIDEYILRENFNRELGKNINLRKTIISV
jgi:hypothetical protein